MSSEAAQLEDIKRQALALLAEITANPKPSYTVDGQTVSWAEYLAQLRATVAWCDERLAATEPFEVASQAGT
jgi:hypothetical protein